MNLSTRKWIYRILLCSLTLASSAIASSEETSVSTSHWKLRSAEAFGNAAHQDMTNGGQSFAGGLHWSPSLELSTLFDVKGYFGGEFYKSTRATGSSIYFVANYMAALVIKTGGPFSINAGGGAATDLRSSGKTQPGFLAGANYDFPSKLFGVFDRAILNGHYYLNSSSLWVVHYGLGVNL